MLGFEADDLIATYARQACEVGANVTIVSSDKDLMQLVNDCVIMYDTMKDKKIGIAEVIEKFGVPPEKVIEVQALIGDSTDNVPGVPGIGAENCGAAVDGIRRSRNAAVKRAGEIKQEKRRQALIDNAEMARISQEAGHARRQGGARGAARRPRGARAGLHAPDRVPEGDGVLHADAARRGILRHERGRDRAVGGGAAAQRAVPGCAGVRSARPAAHRRRHDGQKPRAGAAEPAVPLTPQTLSAARLEAARKIEIDRSRYEVVQDIKRLNEWIARASDRGVVAINIETLGEDPMQAPLCGIALATGPNEACYVPLAHRKGGNGDGELFGGGLAPGQISEKRSARRARSRCWKTRAC